MSIALDGYATLLAIGKHPDVFKPVRADVDKAARVLVVKCLKAKTSDLAGLRAVASALGSGFDLLVDGLSTADLKSMLTRLDKHHADAKLATDDWRRKHLRALAGGEAPAPVPTKTAKGGARKARAVTRTASKPSGSKPANADVKRLGSESMELFRAGGKKKR